MNNKVANLIAAELGILIAILTWLAFSERAGVKQPPVTAEPERTAGSFATVAPALKARPQPLYVVSSRAANSAGEELEDEEQAPAVQQYDQELVTTPSSYPDSLSESPPSYSAVTPEPVPYPADYWGSPLDPFAICPQPTEIIIFSTIQTRVPRNRSRARFGGPRMMLPPPPPVAVARPRTTVTPRRPVGGHPQPVGGHSQPIGGRSHLHDGILVSHQNTDIHPLPQRQRVQPR